MKKIVLAVSFFTTCFAIADTLPDVTFVKYRVLAQGSMIDEERTPVTYIITTNPPMAIMIASNKPDVIRRVATGTLKSCKRFGQEKESIIQSSGAQLAGTLNEMEIIASMSSAHGQSLPSDKLEYLERLRNHVNFINESVKKPIFVCELPNE